MKKIPSGETKCWTDRQKSPLLYANYVNDTTLSVHGLEPSEAVLNLSLLPLSRPVLILSLSLTSVYLPKVSFLHLLRPKPRTNSVWIRKTN